MPRAAPSVFLPGRAGWFGRNYSKYVPLRGGLAALMTLGGWHWWLDRWASLDPDDDLLFAPTDLFFTLKTSDGSFTYEPIENYAGTEPESFTYRVTDGELYSENVATVTGR